SQDRGKFGAAGRPLPDRPLEGDVGDQPALATAAHHVVDLYRLALCLDDLALDPHPPRRRPLARDLQALAGLAGETIGVDRRDVTPEAVDELPLLRLAETGPRGGADRQAGHRRDVEGPADYRLELREPAALPEDAAVLHRAQQRVVQPLHRIAAARRRRM